MKDTTTACVSCGVGTKTQAIKHKMTNKCDDDQEGYAPKADAHHCHGKHMRAGMDTGWTTNMHIGSARAMTYMHNNNNSKI